MNITQCPICDKSLTNYIHNPNDEDDYPDCYKMVCIDRHYSIKNYQDIFSQEIYSIDDFYIVLREALTDQNPEHKYFLTVENIAIGYNIREFWSMSKPPYFKSQEDIQNFFILD